jgi:capsular polysaccharide transport system permease protein
LSDQTVAVADVVETPPRMRKRSSWEIQRAVIFALLMREIKTRFGGHWTGVVWMIGQPLAQVFILVLINTYLRGRLHSGIYPYAVFLISAMLPYRLGTGLWGKLMSAPRANQGLFNYHQVKPLDTVAARVILEVVLNAVIFAAIMSILARMGLGPVVPDRILQYLLVYAIFVGLGTGVGLVLAGLIGPMPKLNVFVSLIGLPLFLLSGVLSSVKGMPQNLLNILLYNPILHLVELARYYYFPKVDLLRGVSFSYPLLWMVVTLFLGLSICRLRQQKLISGE